MMILKGKLTDKQEFFDLLDLIFSTKMSITVKFSSETGAVSMAFNGGNLVHLKSSLDDTRLLICNFYNRKVKVQDFVESTLISLVYKFSTLDFENDYETPESMFNMESFKEAILNCATKLEEIGNLDFRFKKVSLENVERVEKKGLIILGYILSGYSPAQAVFSMGKVREFYSSYRELVERGILR